jgi:Ca2+-binding EF-hand superfamily protein
MMPQIADHAAQALHMAKLLYVNDMQGKLDESELQALKQEYRTNASSLSPEVRQSLEKYDVNHDGVIDDTEVPHTQSTHTDQGRGDGATGRGQLQ